MSGEQRSIKLELIEQGKNPRTYFDDAEMQELVESVRARGVNQPILVRPVQGGRFQIIAGERRWRAATIVYGPEGEIPAMIRECDDEEADVLATVENTIRAAMSATDEAQVANRALLRCKGDRQEAARELGWKQEFFDRRLALMRLTPEVRQALNERKILLGHAELLAAIPQDKQNGTLDKIITHGVTVAQVKVQLGRMAHTLSAAIFDKADCATCNFNSGQQKVMFAESIGEGFCTNPSCYSEKEGRHIDGVAAALRESVPRVEVLRPGSSLSTIKLVVEGALGVGEEQAVACKACANWGCTVSATAGTVGDVEESVCFDVGCNAKKVAAHIQAQAAVRKAAEAANKAVKARGGSEGEAKAAGEDAAKTAKKAGKPKNPGAISKGVKEFREKTWKQVAAKVLFANPLQSAVVLVALGLCGKGRDIDQIKLGEVFKKVTGRDKGGMQLADAVASVAEVSEELVRGKLITAMSATAMASSSARDVCSVLSYLGVKLGDHWRLNDEFLKLLTKSEIESLCEEVGISAAMGGSFKKALAGKRDDLIKAVLAVDGFEYAGVVPRCMRFDTASGVGESEADLGDDDDLDGDGVDAGVSAVAQEQSREAAGA